MAQIQTTMKHQACGTDTSLPASDIEKATEHKEVASVFVDPHHEKTAMRKFDMILLPQIALFVLVCYLDRSNIGNARVFGLEEGLGLKGNQFNTVSTVYFVTYTIFEVPWVVCVKRFGVNRVMGCAMFGWAASTLGMGFAQTYAQAIGCRLTLGCFEAGLLPSFIFFISTIWDQNSQAKRVAVIYVAAASSGAFGGLIAYATQLAGDQHGLASWRWLFIIEGSISFGVCIIGLLFLPTSAEKAWYLTRNEKDAMNARAIRDAAYKGEDSKFQWRYFKMGLMDPFVWVAGITLFSHSVALLGYSIFLPTIIRDMGYTALQANYLTIPVYTFGSMIVVLVAFLSDRLRVRSFLLAGITIPGIVGYAMIIASGNRIVGYVATYLCAGGLLSFSTVFFTWIVINISPEYKRSVALGLVTTMVNCSGLVGPQIYLPRDTPRYVMGNAVSMSCEIAALTGVGIMYFMLRSRNAKKVKLLAEGVTENGKEGDEALGFAFLL